jgi:capsular polysaccharide biosynthesis protein
MNIEIQFIYLDEGFYNFKNSQIPQFFSKKNSIRILSSLGIKSQSRKEKIYISRRNSSVRNLINEDDIIIKLKKFGFRIIDLNDFNIFQQIELFSNADIIVSATGSGLTNIVFCNHNATVVEIIPKYRHHYEDIFKERYKYIAKKLNLKYFSLIADPISIESFSKKYTDKILPNVLEQSNYYKNLLLKLEKLDNFIKN